MLTVNKQQPYIYWNTIAQTNYGQKKIHLLIIDEIGNNNQLKNRPIFDTEIELRETYLFLPLQLYFRMTNVQVDTQTFKYQRNIMLRRMKRDLFLTYDQ